MRINRFFKASVAFFVLFSLVVPFGQSSKSLAVMDPNRCDGMVGEGQSDPQIICNGQFDYEEGEDFVHWMDYGVDNSSVYMDGPYGPAAQIDGTDGSAGLQYISLPVEGGKTYDFSFDTKIDTGYLIPKLAIKGTVDGHVYNKNSDFENILKRMYAGDYQEWTGNTRRFTVPQGFDSLLHRFSVIFYQNGGVSYIDNVTILEVDADNLIFDSKMDALSHGTTYDWGDQTIKTKLYNEEFDSRVIKVETPVEINDTKAKAGIQWRYLDVEPGETYRLDFKMLIELGSIYPMLSIAGNENYNKNGDFSGQNTRLYSSQYDGVETYSRTFTVPNDFDPAGNNFMYLRLLVQNNKNWDGTYNPGVAYFDDVEITKLNVINEGTLLLDTVEFYPESQLMAGGTNELVTVLALQAQDEDIAVNSMKFTPYYDFDVTFSPEDYAEFWLEDIDGNVLGSTIAAQDGNVNFIFENNELLVEQDNDKILYLHTTLNNTGEFASGTSGHSISYGILDETEDIAATGLSSGEEIEVFRSLEDTRHSNISYIYNSYPIIGLWMSQPFGLVEGENYLYHFNVEAVGGDISLYKMSFEFDMYGVEVDGLHLKYGSGDGMIILNDVPGQIENNAWKTEGEEWSGLSEFVIPEGENVHFFLTAQVSGVDEADWVEVTMLNDGNYYGSSTGQLMDSVTGVSPNSNFVWSDTHSQEHGYNSFDWTNGYLVYGLGLDHISFR